MDPYLVTLGLLGSHVDARIRFLADQAQYFRARANEVDSRDEWKRTALFGAAGTCVTQAASLALLGEEANAHSSRKRAEANSLLKLAETDYLSADSPYGLVIQSLRATDNSGDSVLLSSPAKKWLRQVDEAQPYGEGRSSGDLSGISPILSAINQQAYLLMAIANAPELAKEHNARLKRLVQRLRAHPNFPHGPQGQPLNIQLDIFEAVVSANIGNPLDQARSQAMNALRRLASRYADSLWSARRNEYLWANLLSPIDYLDLELVFAARCTAKAFKNVDLSSIFEPGSVPAIPFLVAAGYH